jgi:hypothetical protein
MKIRPSRQAPLGRMPLLQAASHHVLRHRQVLRLPAALPQLRIGLRLTGGGKSDVCWL